jgi:tetratricopeptide (TPR) repeat protein
MAQQLKIYQNTQAVRFVLFYLACIGIGLIYGVQDLSLLFLGALFAVAYGGLLLPECLAGIGGWQIRAGLLEEGMSNCQRALALDDSNYLATANLGYAHYKRGQLTEAEASFSRAIELRPKRHVGYMNRAAARIAMYDYDGAIADASTAMAIGGHDTRSHINKTIALMGKHCFVEALNMLEEMRSSTRHFDFVAYHRMVCKTQLSRLDEAEQEWIQAAARDNKLAHMGRTWLAYCKCQFEEVLTLTADVRDDTGDAKMYRYLRALCYCSLGEGELATRAASQLIVDHPQYQFGLSALTVILTQADMLDEAAKLAGRIEDYDAYTLHSPLVRALIYSKKGEHEKADREIDVALSRCATDAGTQAIKAYVLSDLDRAEEALAIAEPLTKRNPRASWAWTARGKANLKLGRHQAALECFNEAQAIQRYDSYLFERQADALEGLGRPEEAAFARAEAERLARQFKDGVTAALFDYPLAGLDNLSPPKKIAPKVLAITEANTDPISIEKHV